MKNILKIKKNLQKMLSSKFHKNIDLNNLKIMNEGEYLNAAVFRYYDGELDLTIKDFSTTPWIIKNTLGRLFVLREGSALKKLSTNPSITKNVIFLSDYTLAFNFIEGKPLKKIKDKTIPKEFFVTLEKNIMAIHKKDIVHLDLRNLGNIIMGNDGLPYIIDFQSYLSIKYLPNKLKNILKGADITGVYKCWERKCSEPLDQKRKNYFEEFKKIRKIWIFKGYPLKRLKEKIKSLKK
ncbi:RIO1 family regulatory kinase/ATPase [Fusobacterium sp.]|uniref:RIO1 family regulatory kinase/ATPase domain-containing protein n=1 Tax=Fusobacterium sp. TaxID=68766 RepID=UPI00262CB544|nr:RIO1 family regulatory kinase/ATPase [Fusobacterium sp.]